MRTTNAHALASKAEGEAQQLAGHILGDPAMTLTGKAKVLCGKSQQVFDNATAATRENVADKPMTALGIAVAVGFALGAAWSRSSRSHE